MASETATSSSDEISDQSDLSFWKSRNLEFRILILGRANAGKTTILERLADASIDEAEVRWEGKLLTGHAIKGQSERGLHIIDNEIRFRSLPGFVFHDSRGFEAGSAEELSTVQQFVEDHSSAVRSLKKQLHAIWMCLPLDEPREFLETEKEFFRCLKGDAPLVVVFTKRDGAVGKTTRCIVDKSSLSDSTVSRAMKKEARAKAEIQVVQHVKEREEELRQLSQTNSCMVFLTTSDMQRATAQSTAACVDLIKATEEGLTGPRVKTLLSVVWGRNLSMSGFWCLYWILKLNDESGIKLGSNAPGTDYMMRMMAIYMMGHFDFDRDFDDHHFDLLDRRRFDDLRDHDSALTILKSVFGPTFHMYTPALNDVEALTLTLLVMVLLHAVHTQVLSSIATLLDWVSAISAFLKNHQKLVQEKVCILTSQVASIVGEIKDMNILTKYKIITMWKFSHEEAHMFAVKLSKCVNDNLM